MVTSDHIPPRELVEASSEEVRIHTATRSKAKPPPKHKADAQEPVTGQVEIKIPMKSWGSHTTEPYLSHNRNMLS